MERFSERAREGRLSSTMVRIYRDWEAGFGSNREGLSNPGNEAIIKRRKAQRTVSICKAKVQAAQCFLRMCKRRRGRHSAHRALERQIMNAIGKISAAQR